MMYMYVYNNVTSIRTLSPSYCPCSARCPVVRRQSVTLAILCEWQCMHSCAAVLAAVWRRFAVCFVSMHLLCTQRSTCLELDRNKRLSVALALDHKWHRHNIMDFTPYLLQVCKLQLGTHRPNMPAASSSPHCPQNLKCLDIMRW